MPPTDLHAEIAALRQEMAQLREDMKPIIDAYNAGTFTWKAITALAQSTVAIGGAFSAIYFVYTYIKSH